MRLSFFFLCRQTLMALALGAVSYCLLHVCPVAKLHVVSLATCVTVLSFSHLYRWVPYSYLGLEQLLQLFTHLYRWVPYLLLQLFRLRTPVTLFSIFMILFLYCSSCVTYLYCTHCVLINSIIITGRSSRRGCSSSISPVSDIFFCLFFSFFLQKTDSYLIS